MVCGGSRASTQGPPTEAPAQRAHACPSSTEMCKPQQTKEDRDTHSTVTLLPPPGEDGRDGTAKAGGRASRRARATGKGLGTHSFQVWNVTHLRNNGMTVI